MQRTQRRKLAEKSRSAGGQSGGTSPGGADEGARSGWRGDEDSVKTLGREIGNTETEVLGLKLHNKILFVCADGRINLV